MWGVRGSTLQRNVSMMHSINTHILSCNIEDLREDWFANCVKPTLNKDIMYLLSYLLYTYFSTGENKFFQKNVKYMHIDLKEFPTEFLFFRNCWKNHGITMVEISCSIYFGEFDKFHK